MEVLLIICQVCWFVLNKLSPVDEHFYHLQNKSISHRVCCVTLQCRAELRFGEMDPKYDIGVGARWFTLSRNLCSEMYERNWNMWLGFLTV